MRRFIGVSVTFMLLGAFFLDLRQPFISRTEAAEATPEATAAIPTDLVGKIAFVSETSTDTLIYIMNADGSDLHVVVKGDRVPWSPALSPDGKQIAFSAKVNERYQIFVMNSDGTNEKQLTFNVNGQTGVSGLDWSHDGKRLVYTLKSSDNPSIQSYDIYTMNVDGTEQKEITPQPMESLLSPHWSPDDKQIIFDARGNSPEDASKAIDPTVPAHIYIMNADGSNLHRLSQSSYNELFPAWSPDGKTIVFLSGGASKEVFGLSRMDIDGSNLTQLSKTLYSMPTWSPDGKYLAAVLSEKVNDKWVSNVYVMNADGTNPVKITDTQDLYHLPSWGK